MEYIVIALIILLCSFVYDFGERKNNDKDIVFFVVLFILVLFMGLRYRIGIDTIRYEGSFYTYVPTLSNLSLYHFSDGRVEPLFLIFESLTKTLFGEFEYFQIIHSFLTNALICFYLKKHCKYIFFSIFIYYIWRYIPFTTEELRASIAISICLFANDFLLEKKYIRGVSLIILAFGFHTSALFMLIMILFRKVKFDKIGFVVFGVMAVVATILNTTLFDFFQYVNFTEKMNAQIHLYADSDLSGQTASVFGIISNLICYFFYSIVAIVFLKKTKPKSDVLQLQPYFFVGLLMVIASIVVTIFYRVLRYFDIYFIILYAEYFGTKVDQSILFNKKKNIGPFFLFIPFVFFALYLYSGKIPCHMDLRTVSRIYPYTNSITKEIDADRERMFRCYNLYYVKFK